MVAYLALAGGEEATFACCRDVPFLRAYDADASRAYRVDRPYPRSYRFDGFTRAIEGNCEL